jgi:uncharacterized protein YciI
MVAWKDYKAVAKDRGALAFEVFVAESIPQKSPDDVKAVLPDHLAYIQSLETAGSLIMAGPVSDDAGEEMTGAGMLVLRAASMEEARDLVAHDPMHLTGARQFRLRRWLINEGNGLSTREIRLG